MPLSLSYACSGLAFQGRKTAGLSAEFPPAELSCKIKIFVEICSARAFISFVINNGTINTVRLAKCKNRLAEYNMLC